MVKENIENYHTFSGFKDIYLEDSFVLDIIEQKGHITFKLEVILTPDHSLYHEPTPGQQYCYKKADLVFPKIAKIYWLNKNIFPFKDASGEIDFGNVDQFYKAGAYYSISGDWGHLRIASDKPKLLFD